MRFEFYHDELNHVPKLSVDGTVPDSIHLSHWQGNQTPAQLKADTSTEIALNLVGSPRRSELTQGIELVTNNHFDTDGVLSVWTMLHGERALRLRERLIPAAEAGDFSEWTTPDAIRASICIQGSDQPSADEKILSPLANRLAGRAVEDEGEAYELVLPVVEHLLTHTGDYEPLWRAAWERIAAAVESFERGASSAVEERDAKLTIITLAPELYGAQGFDPARHTVPFTAISRYARRSNSELYLIAIPASPNAWFYRIDYPYYSWAETVVRPRITRRDLSDAIARLNELERTAGNGVWRADTSELSSAVKFVDAQGALAKSGLSPERVAECLRAALTGREASLAEGAQGHG